MLAATKERPTRICLAGKKNIIKKVLEFALSLGCKSIKDDTVLFSEALGFNEDESPGVILTGARYREGFTQKELSKLTGIPQAHISAMENSKRSIGVIIAKKLAKVLNTDYRVFL